MKGYALKESDGPSRAANNYGQMVSLLSQSVQCLIQTMQ